METTPKISPQMRLYYRRKEKGLCVECGKPVNANKTRCEECKNRINQNRRTLIHWYQENGICPNCRKNSLVGDERVCLECSALAYSQRIARYNANPEEFKTKERENSKKVRARRIEKGLCARCGKPKADDEFKTCEKCRIETRNAKRRTRHNYKLEQKKEWISTGRCWLCGKPVFEHTKLCEMHYEKSLEYAKKSKEARLRNEQSRTEEIQRTDVTCADE